MIKECILKYKKLTNYNFKIVICKNKLYHTVLINFKESDFVHIAGIHKLKDMNHLTRGSKTNVYNKLLVNDELCDKLEHSVYYGDIIVRLELCKELNTILTGDFQIYSYRKNASNFSKIKADYVLRFIYKKKQCYLFLVKRDNAYHVCNSLICDNRNMVQFNNQYKITRKEMFLKKESIRRLRNHIKGHV